MRGPQPGGRGTRDRTARRNRLLVEAYRQPGATMRAVADEFGLKQPTVSLLLKALGEPARPVGRPSNPKRDAAVARAIEQPGATQVSVAAGFGLHKGSIDQILKRHRERS